MLKKSADAPSRVTLGIRCKSCLHFERTPAFERVCSQLGVEAEASACKSFTPNIVKLHKIDTRVFRTLRTMVKPLRREELNILTFALRNVDLIKKAGLQFGQMVAFSLGQDYLTEYVRGYVIGASIDGSQVYIASSLENMNNGNCAMLTLMRDSVRTKKEFQSHRKTLIQQQRIKPRKGRIPSLLECLTLPEGEYEKIMSVVNSSAHKYVPPTLDNVPEERLDITPIKRGRGRPRKNPESKSRSASTSTSKVGNMTITTINRREKKVAI